MSDWGSILGIAGVVLGVLGIFVTYFLTKSIRPLYAFKIVTLDGVKHPHLCLTFNGKPVPNIYSIRFVFWNGGRKELRREDIPRPKAGPGIVISDNMTVLSSELQSTTGDGTAKLSKHKGTNELFLNFDYLNRLDAVTGEILCTSTDQIPPTVVFKGALKGSRIIKGLTRNLSFGDKFFFVVTEIILAAMFLAICKSGYSEIFSKNYSEFAKSALIFVGLLFLLIANLSLNLLTIPNSLPKRFAGFLSNGTLEVDMQKNGDTL